MSTLVLRSLIENNIYMAGNTTETEPDAAVALGILVIASVLAMVAATKAVGPVARAIKTLLWLGVAAFFLLIAVGVGISLAVTHLG